MDEKTFARFAAKVALPDENGCMVWLASKTRDGYGQLRADGRMPRAHRLAYEHWVGPIPEGLVIDHLCRNRACVRPDHLRAVTQRENVHAPGSEAPAADLATRTHCPRGHELSGENLVPSNLRAGHRTCHACRRASTAAQTAARKATCQHFGITRREFRTGRYYRTDVYKAAYLREKAVRGLVKIARAA